MNRIELAMCVIYGLILALIGLVIPPSDHPSAYIGPALSVSEPPLRDPDARCLRYHYIGWPYTIAGSKNNSCKTWGAARYDEFYPLSLLYYFITGVVIYFIVNKIPRRRAKI